MATMNVPSNMACIPNLQLAKDLIESMMPAMAIKQSNPPVKYLKLYLSSPMSAQHFFLFPCFISPTHF